MRLRDYRSIRAYLKELRADPDGPTRASVDQAERLATYLYEQKMQCPGCVSHSYDDGVSMHWGEWTLFIPGDPDQKPYVRHDGDKYTESIPLLLHRINAATRSVMKAYIRKTDALDRPYYVQYTLRCSCGVDHAWHATGFESYGAAHAHATALGAEIHTECGEQHEAVKHIFDTMFAPDDYLGPNDQAGEHVRDEILNTTDVKFDPFYMP